MSHTIVERSDPEHPVTYTGELLQSHISDLQSWSMLKVASGEELLFINDQLQSSSADEHIYHETLVHSLFLGLKSPKTVLILGGAEGCTAREVLKWPTVERVVQVDWDASLVVYFQIAGTHWNKHSYESPKIETYGCDVREYFKMYSDTFDAILVDLLDPHTQEDIDLLSTVCKESRARLNPGGGLVMNCGSAKAGTNSCGRGLLNHLKTIFPDPPHHRVAMHALVPSYLDEWGFAMIVPKHWSSTIQTNTLPEGVRYMSRNRLLETIQWNGPFDAEWGTFWQEGVSSPKKLEIEPRLDRSQDLEQYGC